MVSRLPTALLPCLLGVFYCHSVAAETPVEIDPACAPNTIPGKAWVERPFAIETTIGAMMPTGELGFGVDWSPFAYTSMNAAAGFSWDGLKVNPQTALAIRIRYPWEVDALGIEGGWSGGPFAPFAPASLGCGGGGSRVSESCLDWDYAHWVNVALTYEHRSKNGFSFRTFLGYASILNKQCFEYTPGTTYCLGRSLPYTGVALGYAFGGGKSKP
jgi:hypothetical protein